LETAKSLCHGYILWATLNEKNNATNAIHIFILSNQRIPLANFILYGIQFNNIILDKTAIPCYNYTHKQRYIMEKYYEVDVFKVL